MQTEGLSTKNRALVGLTLFSMFFGAGNLIFPPFLGALAGTDTWYAMAGFMVTAIGFPVLGVIAVAESGGLKTLAGRVHPMFAVVFTFLIYISIGPGLAIPRTAGTSFEMLLLPFVQEMGGVEGSTLLAGTQFAYSVAFFLVAFIIALNPEKLTQRLGKVLSPALVTLIVILFVGVLVNPVGDYAAPRDPYIAAPFARGFIDGYQTMDTLAALNFGLIIAMNIRAFGIKSEAVVIKETVRAGLVVAVLFFAIYGALAHIGAEAGGAFTGMQNGAQTLTRVADALFGPVGTVILGLIFFIACLNVCVGLLACVSNYFVSFLPQPGYRGWVAIFAFLSMVVANAGLTTILKVSIPILVAIYPVALVLIVLGLINIVCKKFHERRCVYPVTIAVTTFVAVVSAMADFGLPIPGVTDWIKSLPFADGGLQWIVPAIVAMAVGYVASGFAPKKAE